MEIPAFFHRYKVEIDREMKAFFSGRSFPLYDMLKYHLGWMDERGALLQQKTGKALRPVLCLLSSEALCGDFQRSLPAAVAIELVHNFSLIHDDIQDDDRERHGRPSVWVIWGKPQAINAGTAMRVLASESMLQLQERGISAQNLLRAQNVLDETSLRLIEGQYLDLSFEKRLEISTPEYIQMIEGKTAALIACSFEIGALLATDDEETIRCFRDCGFNLGIAFQIMDDLLGIWGSNGKLGKPIANDIRRKKKSFPIVYAWENADEGLRAEMNKIYQEETVDSAGCDRMLAILDDLGAKDRAQRMVDTYSDRARAALANVAIPAWAHEHLAETIDFLTRRDY